MIGKIKREIRQTTFVIEYLTADPSVGCHRRAYVKSSIWIVHWRLPVAVQAFVLGWVWQVSQVVVQVKVMT